MMSRKRTPRRNLQGVGVGFRTALGMKVSTMKFQPWRNTGLTTWGPEEGEELHPPLSTLRKRQINTSISKEEGSRALLQMPTSVAHQQVTVWPHDQAFLGVLWP